MRLLLDTHVFLWLNVEPERLGDRLPPLEDARNELLVSAASTWEIAIRYAAGGLALPESPERYVPTRIREIGAQAWRSSTGMRWPPLGRRAFIETPSTGCSSRKRVR